MPIHFRVQVQCDDCKAVITYEDEPPDWRNAADDAVSEWVEEAKAFIAERPVGKPGILSFGEPTPPYVHRDPFFGTHSLHLPEGRYVICPACDGRAWLGSGPVGQPEQADLAP